MDTGFQPLDPASGKDDKEKAEKRRKKIPFRVLAPNFVTLLGLCAGLTAIRMAIETRFEMAVILVIVAAVMDGLDGRVARFLKGSTKFGAELDSLTDFISFGVAPAIILFLWGLQDYKSFGWIACLIFAICAALRLARFNAALDDPNALPWHKRFFTGVPTPAGAMLGLLPLYLSFLGLQIEGIFQTILIGYVFVVGFLMVSNFPTFSGKTIGRGVFVEWVVPIIIVVVLLVALLLTYPWLLMSVMACLYLLMLPFSLRSFRRLQKRHLSAGAKQEDS